MTQQTTYRLTRGRHSRVVDGKEVILHKGDVFIPTAAELKAFKDKLEPAIIIPPQPQTPPSRPEKPEDMTVPQMREFAKENEIDLGEATKKEDVLKKIQEWQESTKNPGPPGE